MARKYAEIWKAIKAAPVGNSVDVRVHVSSVATVKQGVKKVKTEEVAEKRRLGMPFAGNLKINIVDDPERRHFKIIKFALEWDGERL